MKKSLLLLMLVLLVSLTLVACGGGGEEAPAEDPATSEDGGTETPAEATAEDKHLIIAVDPDYESFDPALAYEVYAQFILHAVYDNLFEFRDNQENLELAAATEYNVSEDGTIYTFNMRDDMVFSSGNPVTSADLKWSVERAINLQGNGAFLADGITGIETPDDYTIIFNLSAPDPSFPTKLSYNIFSIVDSKVAMENGATNAEDAASADTAKTWFDNNSAGSGPYVLETYTPKVEVVLTRNDNYWGEPAYYDKITISTIPDSNTQVMTLQAGDIDIAINVDPEQAKLLAEDPELTIMDAQSLTVSFLLMNRDPEVGGPVADPMVQKAIRLALDYEGIQLLAGPGMITPQAPFPIGLFGSLPALDVSGYRNLDEAKQLLADAGYPDGFDAELFVPTTIAAGVDLAIMAQKIQADLAEVGINVTLVPEDITVSLETYRTGQQQLGLWYWNPDYPDNNSQLAFLPGDKVGLRANWTADMYPELAELNAQAATESDPEARAALLAQIQELMAEDTAFAMLLQHTSQYAVKSNLTGVEYIDRYKLDLKNIAPME